MIELPRTAQFFAWLAVCALAITTFYLVLDIAVWGLSHLFSVASVDGG